MADAPKRDPEALRPANQRGAARLAAVQALYQMDVGRATLEDTLAQFGAFHLGREIEGDQYLPADADFFRQIVSGVTKHQLAIDPAVDRALAEAGRSNASTLRSAPSCAPPPSSCFAARISRRALSSPNMSISPRRSTKTKPPAWSTPRSTPSRVNPARI